MIKPVAPRTWYWMPLITCSIGLFSLLLIVWVQRVNKQLRHEDLLTDAMMDIQIQTATFHLRLEEAISGIPSVDVPKTLEIPDQTIRLVDAILHGGDTEHNRITRPLNDPDLRRRAEKIRSLVLTLKEIGLERLREREREGAGSPVEQRFEATYRELLDRSREMEKILISKISVNQTTSEGLIIGIMLVWTSAIVISTVGLWNHEHKRKSAEEQLQRQAVELAEHREHLAELVERKTCELTASLEVLRLEMAERLQTNKALQKRELEVHDLSSRLLTAQELERRRIAQELHDELGQALNVVKLRLRVVERELESGQVRIRSDCEELLEYLDLVIEDVRRLALDLSPTILEDLGLTAALQWLADNFSRLSAVEVSSHITQIDHLLPREQWITAYRVMQESLTNIGKHANAGCVDIVIQPQDGAVFFSVEDNGAGFDPDEALGRKPAEKGFGLVTMTERVRMIGGSIDVWSREGKGSRISFHLPAARSEGYYGNLPPVAGG